MAEGASDGALSAVKFVRLVWCDASGIRRCRVVPASHLEYVKKAGVGLAKVCLFMPSTGDVGMDDPLCSPAGETRLLPDLGTVRVLPWHPAHAMALVDMRDLASTPAAGAWDCCPRGALRRVLGLAESRYGLSFQVGFEFEFILLRQQAAGTSGLPPPLDDCLYAQTAALDNAATVLDEMVAAIEALGVPVEQIHAESAHGQFEIVIDHADAFKAADNVLLTKEAICSVAARHGLVTSFLPKLLDGQAGSGMHCHLSLWRGDESCNRVGAGRHGLAPESEAFLAGVLAHLPALACLTTPSPNSFRRIQPRCWSGAYRCWGFGNKEAALRVVGPGMPGTDRNYELKTMDATANPHIALAAIIVAGLQGIVHRLELPPPVAADPSTVAGLERLPDSLGAALEAMADDQELRGALAEAFGSDDLVRAFLVTRQYEWDTLKDKTLEEEVALLYARY